MTDRREQKSPQSEKQKIKIRVNEILSDIRAGMSEFDLMSKYGLSSRGLQSAFRKLISAKAIGYHEICQHSPTYEDTCEVIDDRFLQRSYAVFQLPVVDVSNKSNYGWILDLTPQGLKVSGMKAFQGEVMNLLVVPEDLEDFLPFTFKATCRWVSEEEEGPHLGFQITDISPENKKELERLIEFMTVML
ncbi:MAG: PilZ domain-containing protein [Thermodesulfobacteriota bacterium]